MKPVNGFIGFLRVWGVYDVSWGSGGLLRAAGAEFTSVSSNVA